MSVIPVTDIPDMKFVILLDGVLEDDKLFNTFNDALCFAEQQVPRTIAIFGKYNNQFYDCLNHIPF